MIEKFEFDRPVTVADREEVYDRLCELFDRGYRYVEGSQRGDERGGYFLMALKPASARKRVVRPT
jgi:hypothetical protein